MFVLRTESGGIRILSIEMIYAQLMFVTAVYFTVRYMEDPFYRTTATWDYTVICNFLIN